MKILLENYLLPRDLESQIEAFVERYNHRRYHESLDNVTPADAYFGRAEAIIDQTPNHPTSALAARRHRRITSTS